MSMTDPIADFLTRIRNALQGHKVSLDCPSSKLKIRVAEILQEEGYIDGVSTKEDDWQGILSLTLRYDNNNKPAIAGLRRISRPGQRTYVPAKSVPRVRNGLGVAIISTSRGVMTDRDARKHNVGGEVLCEVW